MNKLYSCLGLCKKAGKLKSGSNKVEDAVKRGKAYLVIVSSDASDNTKKNFYNMCKYYDVKYVEIGNTDDLSRAIGKESVKVFCIIDFNMSKMVEKIL